MSDDVRFAVVSTTDGSVMNEALKCGFLRERTALWALDRNGRALEKARRHGVPAEVIPEADPERFCDRLLDLLRRHRIDYVLSYYTDFYAKPVREAFRDRIVNFHPSLLPAFKGMDGFGDAVAYHARFAGNTVEIIDEVMDEGKIVLQTVFPLDRNLPRERLRHRLFVQQVKAVLQTARWLAEGRISVRGREVTVAGARFDDPEYSPALDFEEAIRWEPEDPYA